MKKFLLLMAVMLCAATAIAQTTVSFDFVNDSYGYTRRSGSDSNYDEISITLNNVTVAKIADSGNMRFWSNGIRMYSGAAFTISVPEGSKITAIEATASSSNFSLDGVAGLSWTGSAQSVALAYTKGSSNQALQTLSVTYASDGGVVKEAANISFDETSFEVIKGEEFTAPTLNNPNNLTVAYASSNEAVATVDAATGAVTIVGIGSTSITAASEETETHYAGKATYTIAVTGVAANIAEFIALCTTKDYPTVVINNPVTVVYQNGSRLYVKDESGYLQVYGYNLPAYNQGDVIPAGIKGSAQMYYDVPELSSPVVSTFGDATGTEVVEPIEVNYTDLTIADVNKYILIKGVKVESTTEGTTMTDAEGNTINYKNQFGVLEEGSDLDMVAIVNVSYEAVQIYPVKFTSDLLGITDIELNNNAPVQYFNLQGVEVANPENGLYIRRQGNNVTKVIVK